MFHLRLSVGCILIALSVFVLACSEGSDLVEAPTEGPPDYIEAPLGATCAVDFPPLSAARPSGGTRTPVRGEVGMRRDPFCIAWTDIYANETGFRVVIKYNGGEEFVYQVGANVNEVFPPLDEWPDKLPALPDLDSPQAAGSLFGLKRKDIQATVYALTPSGPIVVDGFALTVQ
jgi:hypothetical protein